MKENELKILENEGYEFISVERIKKPSGATEKRMTVKHLLCGKVYNCRCNRFFGEGQRCTCLRKRKNATVTNTEDYQELINSKYNNEYTVLSDYLGRKKEITLKHNCGHEYSIKRAEFLIDNTGGLCPMCTIGNRNTEETLISRLKDAGLDVTLLEPFETSKTNYMIRNNKCSHEYRIYTYDVISRGKNRCMVCENKAPKNLTIEKVRKEFLDADSNYTLLETEYRGTHNPMKIKHDKCGNIYTVSRTNFLNGRRCPKCSRGKGYSYKEEDLSRHLSKSFDRISSNYRVLNEETQGYPEIDILVDDIGIEFNGLYWHSTDRSEPHNLLEKTKFFKTKNIPVIHIFEDEWDSQQDTVKSILEDILTNKTQYIQDPFNSDKLIPFSSDIASDTIVIDRRWYITDTAIIDAGYTLTETLPPKEFYLTNSCDKRYTEKTEDHKFSIYDCGYYVYTRNK